MVQLLQEWYLLAVAAATTITGALYWRRSFRNRIRSVVISVTTALALIFLASAFLRQSLPWELSALQQPTDSGWYVLAISFLVQTLALEGAYRFKHHAQRSQRWTASVIIATVSFCAACTLFDRAVPPSNSVRPEPSAVGILLGETVDSVHLAITVLADNPALSTSGAAYLTGEVSVSLTIQGTPGADVPYAVVGEGFLASASVNSPTASEVAGSGSVSAWGDALGDECVTGKSYPSEFPQLEGTAVTGHVNLDDLGSAHFQMVYKTRGHAWGEERGTERKVVLPAAYSPVIADGHCLVGDGSLVGDWFPAKSTILSVDSTAGYLASDSVEATPPNSPGRDTQRDLAWTEEFDSNMSGDSDDDAFLAPEYVISTPQTSFEGNVALLAAGLLGGLGLTALFELIREWPSRRPFKDCGCNPEGDDASTPTR
jgi:hypothetical protein